MRQPLHFWVVGGDSRYRALALALSQDGHTVHTYALGPDAVSASDALKGIGAADCVIFPLPAHKGEQLNAPLASAPPTLCQVLDALVPGQLCCAGRVSPELKRGAEARDLRLVDYFDREELAIANAVPVALAVEPYEKSETGEGVPLLPRLCITEKLASLLQFQIKTPPYV